MLKKISFFVLAFVLLSASVCQAYNFPKAFFDIQKELDAAIEKGDNYGIIDAATRQYNIFSSAPKDNDIYEVTAAKTYMIAEAYEKLGDYENAALWFNLAIESNEHLGFDDAARISEEKAKQFTTDFSLYKRTYDTQSYYGAKNEHQIGVLSGIAFDSPVRESLSNESMTLIYHTHGQDFNKYYEGFLKQAHEEGKAVEIAYNMGANEAADIGMINMSSSVISDFADILSKYPNVPIFLRFAGEVNAWEIKPSVADYIKAFRTTANIMRQKAPNVAMVYGLNFVSSWGTEYLDYYPGDEYVDWIGVSLYCKKNFYDTPSVDFRDKIDEIMFYAGDSAKPVIMMEEIVETFGNRKPIMIFESGATGHTIKSGEYSTKWANERIAEILNYLPMKYPQIKAIGYFDQYVSGENDDYSLKNHSEMKEFYNSQITKSHIIQKNSQNDNASAFASCDNGFYVYQAVENISLYAHVYGTQCQKTDYFVDDVWAGASYAVPFSCDIDFSKYTPGNHVLRYNVTDANGKIHSRSVNFTVLENIKIIVDGKELEGLDQPPVAINGRTMVPVRALFDALGADVGWDGETQTITISRDGDVFTMKIGSKDIYRNGKLYFTSDVSPKAINGRTLIPARVAAEELAFKKVEWIGKTQTVVIK